MKLVFRYYIYFFLLNLGVVYLMIFQIAKKAGQVEKTIQKEKAKKSKKESGIKVISSDDPSVDYSTGISNIDLSVSWAP